MITTIYLRDNITGTVEKAEKFHGPLKELGKRILKMQEAYCEDEKPTIIKTMAGEIAGVCDADYSYIAMAEYPEILETPDEYPASFRPMGISKAETNLYTYSWMSPERPGGVSGWVRQDRVKV